MMSKPIKQKDFDQIITLISDAKHRVYVKANTELVTLYYNIGKIVSDKVNQGNWGENTVQELADFILDNKLVVKQLLQTHWRECHRYYNLMKKTANYIG